LADEEIDLSPIIINLEKLPDWFGVLPEIILLVFAAAVILIDLFIAKKGVLAVVSIIGILISGLFSVSFWNVNLSFFNDMFRVDNFAIFFKLLFLGVALLLILASKDYVSNFKRFQGEYYALILIATIGMMLMAAGKDLITLYISLELASISLYILVSFLKDSESTEASLKYLLLGAVASAVLLYGMALVFGVTGETQLAAIVQHLTSLGISSSAANPAFFLGIVLMIAGFGFKIAAVPFQMWVPDVYEGAPTTVTAFLSVASKAAGFAIIMRVFLTSFNAHVSTSHEWAYIFAALAVISMTLGNVAAIPQTNIKRMLGYSSIAQAGYLMVGLAAAGAFTGLESSMPYGTLFAQKGVLFFLAAYALTNIGAFIAIIITSSKINSDDIADYAGMGKRAPLLALALTLCLISLIGIPPAAGFMGKFYIFSMAASNGLLWLVIIAVVNSVISAYYYLRVVKVMWFNEPASAEKVPFSAAPVVALAICCLGVLVLGIIPGMVMKLAETAGYLF
jgi:NADH-quinone oxidoreductase subunit N